jgi:hypothetical protein
MRAPQFSVAAATEQVALLLKRNIYENTLLGHAHKLRSRSDARLAAGGQQAGGASSPSRRAIPPALRPHVAPGARRDGGSRRCR